MTSGWAVVCGLTEAQTGELMALIGERTGTPEQRKQFAQAVGAVLGRGQTRLFAPDTVGNARTMHGAAAAMLGAFDAEAAGLSDSDAATLRALLHKAEANTAEAAAHEQRGRSKKDHQTLAELAQCWRFAFGRWPNNKADGPFMRVVRWINDHNYADLPTGNAAEPYIAPPK